MEKIKKSETNGKQVTQYRFDIPDTTDLRVMTVQMKHKKEHGTKPTKRQTVKYLIEKGLESLGF